MRLLRVCPCKGKAGHGLVEEGRGGGGEGVLLLQGKAAWAWMDKSRDLDSGGCSCDQLEKNACNEKEELRREMRVLRVHSFTGRAGHTLTRDGQAGGEEKIAGGKDDERVNE